MVQNALEIQMSVRTLYLTNEQIWKSQIVTAEEAVTDIHYLLSIIK